MKEHSRKIWIAAFILVAFLFIAFLSLSQAPAIALTVLGKDSVGFLGIKKSDVEMLESTISPKELDAIREEHGTTVRTALDCSTAPPEERIPGKTCIEGLLYSDDKDWTPIPEDRRWLIPIWLAASDRYGVPWELLAATTGARSAFGRTNCVDYYGAGPYRYSDKAWSRWGWEAGSTTLKQESVFCWSSEEPARWVTKGDEVPGGSPHDWVDAIFTQARALSENGAVGKGWNYSGGGSSSTGFITKGLEDDKRKRVFAKAMAEESGMSLRVISTWVQSEGGNRYEDNNWLNIGHTDSGPAAVTQAPEWKKPALAGKTSARWMMGEWGQEYNYVASPGIQSIVKSRNKSDKEQIRAIAESGWATSDEYYQLLSDVYLDVAVSGASQSTSQCLADITDGPLYYPPEPPSPSLGSGAAIGYNKNLRIPRWAAKLAAQYRSDKGRYKPRRDTPDRNRSPMPKDDIIRLLVVAWTAFGYTGDALDERVTKNYAQVGRESGGRPYILQGYIGDVNDTNPAGGLFQFIPSTFDHWNVDGFNDRFNPLDNILAAVNAQVNGPYPILDGSSGWSPPFSDNPYATGGKATLVEGVLQPGDINVDAYQGLPPTDKVSKAVQSVSEGGSPCYIAAVRKWYEAIVKNPPDIMQYMPGPGGTQKVQGGGKLVPCPKNIPQDTYNACYVDRRIIPDLKWIHKKFGIYISDGYSGPLPGGGAAGCFASGYQCHSVAGEHPLGLAVDIVPVPGEDWSKIDQLALWAEPEQNMPRPPFRWVGYNGDAAHGSGHHLHLSWDHSDPAVPYQLVDWVLTMKFEAPNSTSSETGGAGVVDLEGRVSYFNGPADITASGMSINTPGVALNLKPGTDSSGWNNNRTQKWISWAREGRPMMVRLRTQGKEAVLPVIDLGPHESTDRAIDITEAGLYKMGFKSPLDFKTDAWGEVEFLGRKKRG